ncbi:hypothetical protein [Tenacibaculum sp. 190524A02b]|uniref:hypothetical protein n=1 Tax=Tenacibaculum vairaonense TaxID=3137860 RepID=UPI0031FB056A
MTLVGTVLLIDKIPISRKNKGLPDTQRIDLILLPDNRHKPCRFQVRLDKYNVLTGIMEKDRVEVTYMMEMNEIDRNGTKIRFDNNILEGIRRL